MTEFRLQLEPLFGRDFAAVVGCGCTVDDTEQLFELDKGFLLQQYQHGTSGVPVLLAQPVMSFSLLLGLVHG